MSGYAALKRYGGSIGAKVQQNNQQWSFDAAFDLIGLRIDCGTFERPIRIMRNRVVRSRRISKKRQPRIHAIELPFESFIRVLNVQVLTLKRCFSKANYGFEPIG